MQYTIIEFDQSKAQILLRIDDGVKYPDVYVDLPLDDNNRIPEGQDLDAYLKGFMPESYDNRIKKLEVSGIANPEAITVTPVSDEETEATTAEKQRLLRNDMLYNSDWTQLADAPLTAEEKAAWAEYRQALRDITSQEGFPTNIIMPVAPDDNLA